MTDELVKRLRANTSWGDDRFAEAADRIEALTAERDRLREALKQIGKTYPADAGLLIHSGRQIVAIIDAALKGESQ